MENATEEMTSEPEEEAFADTSFNQSDADKEKNAVLKYVQEKHVLQEELEHKDKIIQEYKAKVYDLSSKIKDLQQSVANLKQDKIIATRAIPPLGRGPRSPATSRTGVVRPSTSKTKNTRTKASKGSKQQTKPNNKTPTPENPSPLVGTPEPVNNKEASAALKTLERYKEVATRFPELKFSIILNAEKFFFEADINNDGTIDEDELEKLLDKQGSYMTTKKEVKAIMKDIDKDETGTIDYMEYMAVMERVQQRKRTNLPADLTKSSVCSIQ